jgi:peptidoglycan/LPS O-acetylase OafA/YrhL
VIGALLLRWVPVAYRWPLRSGLLAAGCLSIMILIAAGARRYRQNPTVVPTDPVRAAVISLIMLVIIIVAVEAGLIIVRRRSRDRLVER